MKEFIVQLISERRWAELVTSTEPALVVQVLPFDDTLQTAHHLLYNDEWNEEWQTFANDMLLELRQQEPSHWVSDWRHDAFLGTACDIVLRYNERYKAYQRAYNAIEEPPAELAFALAKCLFTPGSPPISENEAIGILEEGLSRQPFLEGVEFIINLYKKNRDTTAQARWEQKLEILRRKNIHAKSIFISPMA